MKPYKNFITFEGIDFSGKSTQIKIAAQKLRELGFPVHLLREPGGTVISEKIRQVILDNAHQELHPRTEILLYSAARAQLVHQTILPLLEAGEYVLLDRFYDSTTVYQGYGRQLDLNFVKDLNRFATSSLVSYKTLFIDISPQEALRRRKAADRHSDRLDNENRQFYETVWSAYRELIRQFPNRYIVIPGEDSIEKISTLILKKIMETWKLPFTQ
jgi:dTMP kinase